MTANDERREHDKLKEAWDLADDMRCGYTAFHTKESQAIKLLIEVIERRKS